MCAILAKIYIKWIDILRLAKLSLGNKCIGRRRRPQRQHFRQAVPATQPARATAIMADAAQSSPPFSSSPRDCASPGDQEVHPSVGTNSTLTTSDSYVA